MDRVAERLASYSPEEAERALIAAIGAKYKGSLYLTCKSLLGYKDITRGTHGGIIRALEAPTKRKLICVPRGCFKSSIAVVGYCTHSLINNPNLRILIDSELYSNSTTFLREIKAHMESERLTRIFGQFKTSTNWNEGEITIAQRTTPKKEASITCGGIGTTKVGQHYDIIIGDDYNSPKNTSTPEGRRKVIDHIRYNMSILDPGGAYLFTATRYHEEDASGFILRDLMGIKIEDAIKLSLKAS